MATLYFLEDVQPNGFACWDDLEGIGLKLALGVEIGFLACIVSQGYQCVPEASGFVVQPCAHENLLRMGEFRLDGPLVEALDYSWGWRIGPGYASNGRQYDKSGTSEGFHYIALPKSKHFLLFQAPTGIEYPILP